MHHASRYWILNKNQWTSRMSLRSRFCYSYKPPGVIEPTCKPLVCADTRSAPEIVNSMQTTQGNLLQYRAQLLKQEEQVKAREAKLQAILADASRINATLSGQLGQLQAQRYRPFEPYVPMMEPLEITQFKMRTANVGNPMPPMTIAKCKGSQFVTT